MKKITLGHPEWYYKKFDTIFSAEGRCAKDVVSINSLVEIKGKVIQEVGAGTGNHAIEIIKYQPSSLSLIDIDPNSVEILKNRFSKENFITISCRDGLKPREYSKKFDLIICMYSVVQQCIDDFDLFFISIRESILQGCFFIFEFIDIEISKIIYPSSAKTEIYNKHDGQVYISSTYEGSKTTIKISGILEEYEINYSVTLANLTKNHLFFAARNTGLTIRFKQLDETGRRCLACLEKP